MPQLDSKLSDVINENVKSVAGGLPHGDAFRCAGTCQTGRY